MTRPDDLTDLLTAAPAGPAQPMYYRQGKILTWNQTTGENTVSVGGATLTNLPLLNTTEANLLETNDIVGLMAVGSTWAILGRLVIPGTADAASALSAIVAQSADVSAFQSTTSATFTDLATTGPTLSNIAIRSSGRCLVTVGAEIQATAIAGQAIATGAGFMGFAVSGATTVNPVDGKALQGWIRYDATPNSTLAIDIRFGASRTVLLTGLNAGLHTFTAKYKRAGADFAPVFGDRNITVQVL